MMVQAKEEMSEDEAVYEEMYDSLERAATIATSLDAEQDRGNINITQSKATLNEPSSLGTSSGGGPKRQETMGDTIAQTGFENVSKTSNDPLLARVIDLEKTKTSQAQEITSLKRKVKRLERKGGSKTHKLKRLYKFGLSRRVESFEDEGLGEDDASKQGRIADSDADAGINLVSTHFDVDTDMFEVHDIVGDEVVVEIEVASKDVKQIKKYFAAMRAQEKRNKPPTKAQKRNTMSTYLKNMAGYKNNQLKNIIFDDISESKFDKAMKRVNTFVDMETELVEGSEVRAEAKIA
ncbi:hypothetical protein Tco_1080130 [Tanacetum coccineum]|uniref:Uncharacterized protein n=1 Tax=Tanacetum coccineum TaxID=301880 RepID=A0ABQ5HTU0_9ASTR